MEHAPEYLGDEILHLVDDLVERSVELTFECQEYSNGEEYMDAMRDPLLSRIEEIVYLLVPDSRPRPDGSPGETPHPKEAEVRELLAAPLPPPAWIEDDVVPLVKDGWPDGTPYLE